MSDADDREDPPEVEVVCSFCEGKKTIGFKGDGEESHALQGWEESPHCMLTCENPMDIMILSDASPCPGKSGSRAARSKPSWSRRTMHRWPPLRGPGCGTSPGHATQRLAVGTDRNRAGAIAALSQGLGTSAGPERDTTGQYRDKPTPFRGGYMTHPCSCCDGTGYVATELGRKILKMVCRNLGRMFGDATEG